MPSISRKPLLSLSLLPGDSVQLYPFSSSYTGIETVGTFCFHAKQWDILPSHIVETFEHPVHQPPSSHGHYYQVWNHTPQLILQFMDYTCMTSPGNKGRVSCQVTDNIRYEMSCDSRISLVMSCDRNIRWECHVTAKFGWNVM